MAPSSNAPPSPKARYSKPLTREKVAAAAIEIVRREGQSALSMRKVAGLFGVDVAALYRHFRDKDELLDAVGQLASQTVDLEAPATGSWDSRLIELAERIRNRITEHPELGIYGGDSPFSTPFFARANGLIAELLCEAGLEGRDLVFSTQTVLHLVISVAESETTTRRTPRDQNRAFARTVRDNLSDEVRKSWPSTRSQHEWSVDYDALFEFALRTALDGIESKTRPSR